MDLVGQLLNLRGGVRALSFAALNRQVVDDGELAVCDQAYRH